MDKQLEIANKILKEEGLKNYLEAFKINEKQFFAVSYQAFTRNPNLLNCTTASLTKCFMDAARIGLPIDFKDAYISVYGNRAVFMPDYKGLIKLGLRTGKIKKWEAVEVCQEDEFSWKNGVIDHAINYKKPRGEIILTYSRVKFANDEIDVEISTRAEIDKIKDKAPSKDFWNKHFTKMARKTAVNSHAKRLDLSKEIMDAIDIENEMYEDAEPETSKDDILEATFEILSDKTEEKIDENALASKEKILELSKIIKNIDSITLQKQLSTELQKYMQEAFSIDSLRFVKNYQVNSIRDFILKFREANGC